MKSILKVAIGVVFGFLISGWVVEQYFNDRININEVTNQIEFDGINPENLELNEKLSLYCNSLYLKYNK
ncbi:MAG: hypothetical protein P8L20_06225 [Flavobacteriales bacterium]|nr:hypothetical protein [Flavobacteriales bacterium]